MAGIGIIGGAVAQPIAAHFAQKRAWKYTQAMMKNRYQWMVGDLRAAGLNPILAVSKSAGIGASGIPSIAGGMGATALGAMKLRAELDLLRSTADKARSEAELNRGRTKRVDLEVKEFKPTVGGIVRRVLGSDAPMDFLKSIEKATQVPDWVKDRLKSAAQR